MTARLAMLALVAMVAGCYGPPVYGWADVRCRCSLTGQASILLGVTSDEGEILCGIVCEAVRDRIGEADETEQPQ